jgi:carbon storage regulator CsrA
MAMLVLSRKIGERILVPHCEMSITVLAIEGNTVRLGVSAPAEVGVYREELWQRVCGERGVQDPMRERPGRMNTPGRSPSPAGERS